MSISRKRLLPTSIFSDNFLTRNFLKAFVEKVDVIQYNIQIKILCDIVNVCY